MCFTKKGNTFGLCVSRVLNYSVLNKHPFYWFFTSYISVTLKNIVAFDKKRCQSQSHPASKMAVPDPRGAVPSHRHRRAGEDGLPRPACPWGRGPVSKAVWLGHRGGQASRTDRPHPQDGGRCASAREEDPLHLGKGYLWGAKRQLSEKRKVEEKPLQEGRKCPHTDLGDN